MEGPAAALHPPSPILHSLHAGQLGVDVLGSLRGGGDEWQVDAGGGQVAQLALGLLSSLGQPLQRLAVLAQVQALVLLEVVRKEVHDALVKVVTTQVGVTAGAQHLEDAIAHLQASPGNG